MNNNWQPIGTAPKDGRSILIFEPTKQRSVGDDDLRYAIGYWRTWNEQGGWGNRNNAVVSPTHWMPLPPAPDGTAQ